MSVLTQPIDLTTPPVTNLPTGRNTTQQRTQANPSISPKVQPRILQVEAGKVSTEVIKRLLPHGPEFTFVDEFRVVGSRTTRFGESRYVVTQEACKGHFDPNRYGLLFPGVLIQEAAAQCGACFIRLIPGFEDKIPVFDGRNTNNIENMAKPGDVLDIRTRLIKIDGKAAASGTARAEIFNLTTDKKIGWTRFNFRLMREESFRLMTKTQE